MPPAVVAVTSLVMTVASTAISVYGQKKQREAIRAQAKNDQIQTNLRSGQSAINDRAKARVARLNAKQVSDEAQLRMKIKRMEGDKASAGMIAQMSRQGLDLGSESFGDALASDAMDKELQQTFELYDGAKQQQNLFAQAEGFDAQAKVTRSFGDLAIHNIGVKRDNQITASRIQTWGTVAEGIGSTAGSFGDAWDAGVFG
jgi:hypothetical protein